MLHPLPPRPPTGPRLSFDGRSSLDNLRPPQPPPATNDVQPELPSVLAEEPIPRMKSIAPCIFVPLETDITRPREPPRSRVDKLERRVGALQTHRPGVLENIAYMAEREKLAIQQYARQREAMEGVSRPITLPPEEEDWIMGNMLAPAPNRKAYVSNEEELQNLLDAIVPGRPSMAEETVREQAGTHLQNTVTAASTTAAGYINEVDKKIQEYQALLEREKIRLEDAGKRPEERRGSGELGGYV